MSTALQAMRADSPTSLHTMQFELVQGCPSLVQNVSTLKQRRHQKSPLQLRSRGLLASCRRQLSAPLSGSSGRPLCSVAERAQVPLKARTCTSKPRLKRRVAPLSSATPRQLPQPSRTRRRATSAGPFPHTSRTMPRKGSPDEVNYLPQSGTGRRLPPAEAAIRVQRWWRRVGQLQSHLFDVIVKELLELRTRAAREIQRTWRSSLDRRVLTSLGPAGSSNCPCELPCSPKLYLVR